MSLPEMKADLPTAFNVGTKPNSKGYKTSWIGYKLHIDTFDGGIPISSLLTSASLHDIQVAIPLAEITNQRITHCYDLMDAASDAPLIRSHSESLGHVALIDENPRTKERKAVPPHGYENGLLSDEHRTLWVEKPKKGIYRQLA
jgi:hypothetical protein